MAKKQYSFHLDSALHRRVRVEAAQRDIKISDVVEEALREHFRRKKEAK